MPACDKPGSPPLRQSWEPDGFQAVLVAGWRRGVVIEYCLRSRPPFVFVAQQPLVKVCALLVPRVATPFAYLELLFSLFPPLIWGLESKIDLT